jgi:hypothetical protein
MLSVTEMPMGSAPHLWGVGFEKTQAAIRCSTVYRAPMDWYKQVALGAVARNMNRLINCTSRNLFASQEM